MALNRRAPFQFPDDPNWELVRRAHYFITELISEIYLRHGVGPSERRLLDSLDYTQKVKTLKGGFLETPVAITTLSKIAGVRVQSAISALERMAERHEWVERIHGDVPCPPGSRSRNRWKMTEVGFQHRRNCVRAVDHEISGFLDDADPALVPLLLDNEEIAVKAMKDRCRLIVETEEGVPAPVQELHAPEVGSASTGPSLRRRHHPQGRRRCLRTRPHRPSGPRNACVWG